MVVWLLALALVTFALAQLVLVIGLLVERAWQRASMAFVCPVLAPLFGLEAGGRLRFAAYAWLAAVAAYALTLAVARF